MTVALRCISASQDFFRQNIQRGRVLSHALSQHGGVLSHALSHHGGVLSEMLKLKAITVCMCSLRMASLAISM
jgi:hypothetical protein